MSVARWLETDSLSNQNMATALAVGAYTADADRMVVVDVSLDQVAGNGDYVIYLTRQINGAGSSYVMLPKTTCTAASGETALAMQSGMISVRSGDVLTVYVDGLAGDTTTPDTIVRWFEVAALRPTTADRTLDVSAGGEAGVDWANVGSPTTEVGLSGTTVKTATDIATAVADVPTVAEFEARTLAAADYTVVSDLPSVPTAIENADALLTRDWTSVTGEAARSLLNAARFLRNKWSISGGTLTVTEEDDTTAAWTAAVTGTPSADPVTAVDPA